MPRYERETRTMFIVVRLLLIYISIRAVFFRVLYTVISGYTYNSSRSRITLFLHPQEITFYSDCDKTRRLCKVSHAPHPQQLSCVHLSPPQRYRELTQHLITCIIDFVDPTCKTSERLHRKPSIRYYGVVTNFPTPFFLYVLIN